MFVRGVSARTYCYSNALARTRNNRRTANRRQLTPKLFAAKPLSPAFAYLASRGYCATSVDQELSMNVDQNGVVSVAVPLPSNITEVFRLSRAAPVRSLMSNITAEDPAVKKVEVKRIGGTSVAKSTLMQDILYSPVQLIVNDKVFAIKSTRFKMGAAGEYRDIAETAEFQQLKQRIEQEAEKRASVTYDEFREWCEDVGVGESADDIANVLNDLELVFHFKEHVELKGQLFIRPSSIIQKVEKEMDITTIKRTQEDRLKFVQELESKLKPMHDEYHRLRKAAARSAAVWGWSGLALLSGQFLIFARLTWWEYAWDVMEPITYFVTVGETVLAGYIFFLFSKNEFTFISARQIWVQRKLQALIRSNSFPITEYEELKKKRLDTLAEIELYRDAGDEDDLFADDEEEL